MLNLIQSFMTVINELKKYVPKIHILGSNSVFNISSKNTHNCKFKMAVNDPLLTSWVGGIELLYRPFLPLCCRLNFLVLLQSRHLNCLTMKILHFNGELMGKRP
jgi:hypothetical protein